MTQLPRFVGGGAVVLLGDAPKIVPYLARLDEHKVLIEVATEINARVLTIARQYRRTVLLLGDCYSATPKELIALAGFRNTGAVVLSVCNPNSALGTVVDDVLLPHDDLMWFVPEMYRTFEATPYSRVQFARWLLQDFAQDNASWLAQALMVCPSKMNDASARLCVSRAGLERRMLRYGMTWHGLCDRLILHVCTLHSVRGDYKKSALALELGCTTAAELSRRLARIMAKLHT